MPEPVQRKQASSAFTFTAAARITRVGNTQAVSLRELQKGLQEASEASIFHHTFQSLEAHHYLTEGFTNDFAQWTLAACNESALAEQLAAVDVRDYFSIADLRGKLTELVSDYLTQQPGAADRPGFEPFYFCETVSVSVPTGVRARTLAEFVEGIRTTGLSAIHNHFLISRLRLQLASNDFSQWLRNELELRELAEQIERLDIYTNTLEGVRQHILELAAPWLDQA
ncbi:MAG: DUF5752 family protein [Terriglobia bacterium]